MQDRAERLTEPRSLELRAFQSSKDGSVERELRAQRRGVWHKRREERRRQVNDRIQVRADDGVRDVGRDQRKQVQLRGEDIALAERRAGRARRLEGAVERGEERRKVRRRALLGVLLAEGRLEGLQERRGGLLVRERRGRVRPDFGERGLEAVGHGGGAGFLGGRAK